MNISIIIPIYNGELYIERIINNLNEQIYRDFEVIFINDGSTDKSMIILRNYIDNNLCNFEAKLYSQIRKGVSTARNLGISKAIGKYLCFIDVDDGIAPGYLYEMFNIIENEDADVIFCKASYQRVKGNNKYIIYNKIETLQNYLYRKFTLGLWTMLIKSNIIHDNKLKFKDGFRYSEDLHMIWRIFEYSNKIISLNKILYIYNTNQGSAMRKFNKDRFDSIFLFKDLEWFFLENNKEFYPLFIRFAVPEKEWSLLWQAAFRLTWNEFYQLTEEYNFKIGLKKLLAFPVIYKRLSSAIFLISRKVYYFCVILVLKVMKWKIL